MKVRILPCCCGMLGYALDEDVAEAIEHFD
jgi:hypothetical protein